MRNSWSSAESIVNTCCPGLLGLCGLNSGDAASEANSSKSSMMSIVELFIAETVRLAPCHRRSVEQAFKAIEPAFFTGILDYFPRPEGNPGKGIVDGLNTSFEIKFIVLDDFGSESFDSGKAFVFYFETYCFD